VPDVNTPCHSDTVAAVIRFERSWANRRRDDGRYLVAVREAFGMSVTRYTQVLNAALDTREALEVDPVTVNRLRRLRERHQRSPRTA
jgi:hypothetical protein